MYDISSASSLQSLTKWWNDFREWAPVREGEEEDFCVGNKVDIGSFGFVANTTLNGQGKVQASKTVEYGEADREIRRKPRVEGQWKVSEEEVLSFVKKLIPKSHIDEGTTTDEAEAANTPRTRTSTGNTAPTSGADQSDGRSSTSTSSKSITITNNTHKHFSADRRHGPNNTRGHSYSSISYSYGTKASMSSLATRDSLHQTPSSSYFNVYESAWSSPIPFPGDCGSSIDRYGSISRRTGRGIRHSRSQTSIFPESTSSVGSRSSVALIITQSLFKRSTTPALVSTTPPLLPELLKPDRRPKFFFASAKTGEGVNDVFKYIAKRIIVRWEWEARAQVQYRDGDEWTDDIIRVGLNAGSRGGRGRTNTRGDADDDRWGTKIGNL